jgi:NADPH:quinone reductase-like Zn-dependent oxidoreductase
MAWAINVCIVGNTENHNPIQPGTTFASHGICVVGSQCASCISCACSPTITSKTAPSMMPVSTKPGDWVVQNAGNSGVGRSLSAIAKLRGIRTISLVRRLELIDELKAAGADVVLMDEPAAIEEAVRIIGKGSVRLAVDSVGGDATATLVQLLSDHGVLVSYSAATGRPMAVNALFLIGKHLTVKGFFLGDFDHVSKVLPAQIEAAPLVASGALRVPVAAVYPMPKIKEAVTHLLKGGKILIDIAGRRESTS